MAIHCKTPAAHVACPDRRSVSGFSAHARGSRGCGFADHWRGSGWRPQSAGGGQVTGPAWTQPAPVRAVSLLALGGGTSQLWHLPLDRYTGSRRNHDPPAPLVGSRHRCHHRLDPHCHSLRHGCGHSARHLGRLCGARRQYWGAGHPLVLGWDLDHPLPGYLLRLGSPPGVCVAFSQPLGERRPTGMAYSECRLSLCGSDRADDALDSPGGDAGRLCPDGLGQRLTRACRGRQTRLEKRHPTGHHHYWDGIRLSHRRTRRD